MAPAKSRIFEVNCSTFFIKPKDIKKNMDMGEDLLGAYSYGDHPHFGGRNKYCLTAWRGIFEGEVREHKTCHA